jgi:DNA transposition AAA+ family ATPase
MSETREPIGHLVNESRVRGAARVLADGTKAEAVSAEAAHQVTAAVVDYLTEKGMSRAELAKAIGVAASTLGQVLAHKYPGKWREVVLDLDRWLEDQQKRDAAPRVSSFVRTKVAEEILAVANAAITLQTIGLVFGPSGAGKTMALEAVSAEKPGSVMVTVEKLNATASGLVKAIGRAMRMADGQCQYLYQRIKTALAGTPRLLVVDQIHNLCNGRDDRALYVLADLHDATRAPQHWCGTTDLVGYLDRGQAKGHEPLSQIRRRIGICRDLSERTRDDGGGPGEPLYTVEEILQVFGRGKMRLATDAGRYLQQIANLPDGGFWGRATTW